MTGRRYGASTDFVNLLLGEKTEIAGAALVEEARRLLRASRDGRRYRHDREEDAVTLLGLVPDLLAEIERLKLALDEPVVRNAHAEAIEISSDEAGFEMRVVTGDGDYTFNIHGVAWEFAAHVDAEIGSWRREGERARGTQPPRLTDDDLDAYPPGDPKRIALQRRMEEQ